MIESYHPTIQLEHWQSSPCLIPVMLGLLKEKFDGLSHRNQTQIHLQAVPLQQSFQAYQQIYQHWKKAPHLNPKQQEWMQEIGGYIDALQHTLFKFSHHPTPMDTADTLTPGCS